MGPSAGDDLGAGGHRAGDEPRPEDEPAPPPGFAQAYAVEVLYGGAAVIDREAVAARLALRSPASVVQGGGGTGPLVVGHLGEPVEFSHGTAYPTTAVLHATDPEPHLDRFRDDLPQTWGWRGAADAVDATVETVLVTDALATWLQPPRRLELFHAVLAAVVEVTSPLAIHWAPAGQLVEPGPWLQQLEDGDRLHGAVNVRLFRDAERPGVLVMDTLGLAALGSLDVQCHFHDLEPGLMAAWLRTVAKHLFDNGPVLAAGATVSDLFASSRWNLGQEVAMIGPPREVLDVDTGPGHAAGLRRR